MDAIIFQYWISLIVSKWLDIYVMDVVTTHLYESINIDIYMQIPEGFKLPETTNPKPWKIYSIKLQRSLYILKWFGCMRYNHLNEYLFKKKMICE